MDFKLHVVLANLAGDEMCRMDVPAGIKAAQLKDSLARELGMYPYTFKVITAGGVTVEGDGLAKDLCQDCKLDLTMVKIDGIPHPDSKGYVRLQAGPEPGFGVNAPVRRTATALPMSFMLAAASIILLKLWPYLRRQKLARKERRFLTFIAYVVYLLEALFLNRTAKGLKMLKHTEGILDYIQKIKACKPAPEVHAQCYHMETRTSTVVDEDGTIHTESYEVRVNTASLTEPLKVSRWKDITGDVAYGLRYFPLLQVHFEVSWEVGDWATSQKHEEQRHALRRRAEAADELHEVSEKLRLVEEDGPDGQSECTFRSDMIGTTGGSPPLWLGFIPYALCTSLGLSWPYRYCLSRQAIKGEVLFRKKVWSTPAESQESGQLTALG